MSTGRDCPRCRAKMQTVSYTRKNSPNVVVDRCRFCHGCFFDAGEAGNVLGQEAESVAWKDLWITSEGRLSEISCPHDGRPMTAHALKHGGIEVEVDVCPACAGLWLDHNEARTLAKISKAANKSKAQHEEALGKPRAVSYLFQLATSLPIEVWHPLRAKPFLLYALVISLVSAFLIQSSFATEMRLGEGFWMMIPEQVTAGKHLHTVLTSGFLHLSVAHILGNIYFLWIFGDNIEDTLGWRKFSLVYFGSLVAGSLSHIFSHSDSPIPVLGASGAIAGVMGAYLVLFPKVQLWYVFIFYRFRMSARWYLSLWVLFQIVMQTMGGTGVAWMAHIGGFAMGALMAAYFQQTSQLSPDANTGKH